jgi:LuxR family maltose regulon positive regulatory protein
MFLIEPSPKSEMTKPQLIFEKLTMPLQAAGFSRPRLLSILEISLNTCTSTILSARAGAGKTVLAADFAHRCGRPAAWYKVDAPDGDLRVFFDYLTACIREKRPSFGSQRSIQLLTNSSDEQATLLAESFVYELLESGTEPLLIVIEDLHLVCDSGWVVPFFSRLLPLLPTDVHVLITSRTMPPAPLWRMRSKQTLTVLDEETLGFTRHEAVEFFESYGLSAEEACIAFDHTHGRAAGLASFAATLQLSEGRNGGTVIGNGFKGEIRPSAEGTHE